jgi:hypothetical protein
LRLIWDWGWGAERAAEEVNSNVIYLIHCKIFYKYSNVPPLSTTKIKKEKI